MRPGSLIRFITMICLSVTLAVAPAQAVTNKISANYSSGSILIGPNSNTCNTGLQGALRFMSSGPSLAFCDGVTSGWTSLGGGGGAAGSNTQVQFNSGGSMGASSNFTWDMTNNILSLSNTGTGAARAGDGTISLPSHSFNTVASRPFMTMSTRMFSENVYISTLGLTDWAYWAGPTGTPTQRKSGGGSLIGVATKVGTGTFGTFDYGDKGIYWTDGTPTAAGNDYHGLYIGDGDSVPGGINVTFPADTNLREARLYFGYSNTTPRVTAILSDGSVANIVDTSLPATTNQRRTEGSATVIYAAASASQTLTIRVEDTTTYGLGDYPTTEIFAATVKTLSSTAGAATGIYMAAVGSSLDLAVGGVKPMRLMRAASGVNYFRIIPAAQSASPMLTNGGSDTAGNGLGINLTGRLATSSGQGGSIVLTGTSPGGGASQGGSVFSSAGNGGATGAGGSVTFTAGNGGATSGNGGAVTIASGNYGSVGTGIEGSVVFKIGSIPYLTIRPAGTSGAFVMNGNDAATIPGGAQPSSPVNGMIHYNTGTNKLEGRENGAWANLVVGGSAALNSLSDVRLDYTSSGSSQTSMYFGRTAAIPSANLTTSMGAGSMAARSGGTESAAFGALTMSSSLSASYHTFMGAFAGAYGAMDDTSNSTNFSFGAHALSKVDCGNRNTAIGSYALSELWYPSDCRFTAVGYKAGLNTAQTSSQGMEFFGSKAVGGGWNAGYGDYNIFFGASAGNGVNMSPSFMTMFGAEVADSSFTADSYSAVAGSQAYTGTLTDASSGVVILGKGGGAAITSGKDNVFAGYQTGNTTTTGSSNTLIGSGIVASSATASDEISFGNVLRAARGSGLVMRYDANQHMNYKGTAPTISGCTSGTVVGNDNVFKISTGATSATTCTVTFAGGAFVNPPVCLVSGGTASVSTANISAVSTTAITISWFTSATNQTLYVMCRGYL
ncbi:MAG: hypothetical protein JWO78_2330 [Micavibrio sp.]|nr:hypothetical protein [Micavibrio sp.]